jgi:DNA-binding XRE family transcriptional regulator
MLKPKRKIVRDKKRSQPTRPVDLGRLLYTRSDVARLLSVSSSTLIRMENDGLLQPLKLGAAQNCKTLYRSVDVHRLAGIEQEVA